MGYSFKKSQNKLIASAQRAKREIAEGLATLIAKEPNFSESLEQFRQELIEEDIEINPDEFWGSIRDYSPV